VGGPLAFFVQGISFALRNPAIPPVARLIAAKAAAKSSQVCRELSPASPNTNARRACA
jgi:hypothetical protein